MLTFAVPSLNKREHSSAGSEHLPYKQRVRGSNPFAPTRIKTTFSRLLFDYGHGYKMQSRRQVSSVLLFVLWSCASPRPYYNNQKPEASSASCSPQICEVQGIAHVCGVEPI